MINPDQAVLFHASVVSDLLGALLEERLAGTGLSPRAFEVATVLSTRGPAPPGEIAAVTGVPSPSMSRIVGGMQRDGLVSVRAHPTDRRSRVVELSEDGRRAFGAAQTAFLALLADLQATLGESASLVAWGVRRLEWALRATGGAEQVDPLADAGAHAVFYAGARLHPGQEAELLAYLDWLRHRDRDRPSRRRGA